MNTDRDIRANTWTIAYRNPRANHFKRVTDWSGTWAEAEKMAGKVKAANPDLEIWYTGTLESEQAGYVAVEDCGNILVPNTRGRKSRRVSVRETGSIAALGLDVPAACAESDAPPVRMPIGPRSRVLLSMPGRPGTGATRSWSRDINGKRYAFTVVNMPNGDIRWSVSYYNGYGDDGTARGRESGMRFGCAWSRYKFLTLRPPVCTAYGCDDRAVFRSSFKGIVTGAESAADGCEYHTTLWEGSSSYRHSYRLPQWPGMPVGPMPIGPRSQVVTVLPATPDGTTSRSWTRSINGTEYRFSQFSAPRRPTWYVVDTAETLDKPTHRIVVDSARPIRLTAGPRSEIFTMLPYAADGTVCHQWTRTIGSREFSFTLAYYPGSDARYGVLALDSGDTKSFSVPRPPVACFDVQLEDNRPVSAHPAYDAVSAETGTDPVPGWTELGDMDVFQMSRPAVAPEVIHPRFGVLVEYDDDGEGRAAVIGSYLTWDEAREARDSMEASDRWDYVRGVVPLYASESDV